ncbi:MAG: DEAD/DEAH box helicase [Phycisphaerales bacterium]
MTPDARQTMLFSATMPASIRTLADRILREPEFIQVDPVASTAKAIQQSVHRVEKGDKPYLLTEMLSAEVERTLVFTRTKHGADKLVKGLRRSEIHADAIHGNKSQNARTRALDAFRSGRTAVLVATDVAARGIDVDGITHVFNFDIPMDPETYVHRIGRTAPRGSAGCGGVVLQHRRYLASSADRDDARRRRAFQIDRSGSPPAASLRRGSEGDRRRRSGSPVPARPGKKRRQVPVEIGLAKRRTRHRQRKPRTRLGDQMKAGQDA